MKPNNEFLLLPDRVWSSVKLLGQQVGYTDRATRQIKVPSQKELLNELDKLGLNLDKVTLGILDSYFKYRAGILNTIVRNNLMDAQKARKLFENYYDRLQPKCPLPKNKQSGAKKAPAYFTGLINMIIESNSEGMGCDYDPRQLPFFYEGDNPVYTLSRRVDGAFPTIFNPIALWEIKEYYYTTTFGSRIADAIYETTLDGFELRELSRNEKIKVKHYLMVDAYETWWEKGKSYLCRIIDLLHMGFADEILFGYEIVERLPRIVREWVDISQNP